MQSFLADLLNETPDGRRELVRAQLRVNVTEALLVRMEAQDINKAQLAAMLGVSRSAMSQALTGTRNMSLNTLADMAAALGLKARVLLEAPAAPAAEHSRAMPTAGNTSPGTVTLQPPVPRQVRAFHVLGTSTSAAQVAAHAAVARLQ